MNGGEDYRLTFTCELRIKETQEKIIKNKMHCSKVYNTFYHEVREGKVDVGKIKRINEDGGKICKRYREENGHSKYLHSHTLQQIILNCIREEYLNSGKIINADVNGSINILRKYIKEVFSPNLEIAMDIGREQRRLKKRVA